jgi:hypothetical protein
VAGTGSSVDAGISGDDGHCRISAGNCSISLLPVCGRRNFVSVWGEGTWSGCCGSPQPMSAINKGTYPEQTSNLCKLWELINRRCRAAPAELLLLYLYLIIKR